MLELSDIVVYLERLEQRFSGQVLRRVRIASPFVVRSFDPPITALVDRRLLSFRRMGKRLVLGFDEELYLVIHLMIAGRLRLAQLDKPLPKRFALLSLDFEKEALWLTEAGTTRRASVHVVRGEAALLAFDRGGVEPLACTTEEFARALRRENHTVKRSLSDPRLVSGIGNAYSDEILFAAKLSPLRLTSKLSDSEVERLHAAARATLLDWVERLRAQSEAGFPEKVTAFHDEMAVHGRYGKPCPVCATKIQRVRYATNELNYCPRCQTEGRLLADRAMSRLLRDDFPKSIDELEADQMARAAAPSPAAAPVKTRSAKKGARS